MNVFELFMSSITFFAKHFVIVLLIMGILMVLVGPLVIALLIMGILMVLVGGGCCCFWGHELWFRWQLRRRGIVVEGQVVRRQETRGYKGGSDYTLICRYIYNGQTYIEWSPVSSVDFRRNVQLRLLPDSPEKARVIESESCFAIASRVIKMGFGVLLGISFMVGGVWGVVVSLPSLLTPYNR
jgi:Protein of unknown function (DUF3592)